MLQGLGQRKTKANNHLTSQGSQELIFVQVEDDSILINNARAVLIFWPAESQNRRVEIFFSG